MRRRWVWALALIVAGVLGLVAAWPTRDPCEHPLSLRAWEAAGRQIDLVVPNVCRERGVRVRIIP